MDLVYPHILSFPILFVFLFHFRASFGIFAFILKTNSAYTSSKFNALHRIDIDKSTNRRTIESTNQPTHSNDLSRLSLISCSIIVHWVKRTNLKIAIQIQQTNRSENSRRISPCARGTLLIKYTTLSKHSFDAFIAILICKTLQ